MSDRGDPTAAVERALERFLRLSMGRGGSARQAELVGAPVSRAGYTVLRTLGESGSLPLGELAERCAMDPGAAVRQVRSLEGEALVERSAAAHDGRLTQVALTRRGTDVVARLVGLRVHYMDRVLDGWTPTERSRFAASVDRLTDALLATPYPASPAEPPAGGH